MPADLPGFYFDPEKGKYFKIQPNHVAPKDSKYSKQAVTAERKVQNEMTQTQQHGAFIRRNRISRSPYLESPYGLLLRRQLGEIRRNSSTDIVKRAYARDLRERTIFQDLRSDGFAVEPKSKQLFAFSSPRATGSPGRERGRDFCIMKPTTVEVFDEDDAEGGIYEEVEVYHGVEKTSYSRDFTFPIHDATQELICVEPGDTDIVVWVTREVEISNAQGAAGGMPGTGGSRVHFSSRGWPGEEYGGWGTSVNNSAGTIRDLKLSPYGRKLLFGEEGSIFVLDPEAERGQDGRRLVDKPRKDWMCVEWAGDNVVIGGNRSGEVWLADVRVGGGAVRRAICPWAVSAVRSVGREGILVWGLEGGRMFDLRYNHDEASRNTKSDEMTKPAMVFDVKDSWMQKRYGMGWDYDKQLGLVASASTDFRTHRVGLWDVNTGRRIEEGQLAKKEFSAPVTCLQMVDLESRGFKSLLTACDGKIQSWEV